MQGPNTTKIDEVAPSAIAATEVSNVSFNPPLKADFIVVGIGASAGGLAACEKVLDATPDHSGIALILVQHLEPTHPSLMVELLARHTSMTVQQAS